MSEPEGSLWQSHVGPYRIERRLGSGGMGVVYLGHHDNAGTTAAVKLLRPEFVADPHHRARLRRELDAALRVPRSCTAAVLGADLDGDPPWVATEFIDGPTLDVALLERGRLSGEALLGFATGVAVALWSIHAEGVIHRDLKPSNVLLSADGPRVIDFGIAYLALESGTQLTKLTQPGAVVGTPAYMAPEQLRGEQATSAVDIFAWASLVTYAATGRPPFGFGQAAMHDILFAQPDLSEIPDALRPLVAAAFDKDPAGRPTADDLVARLSPGRLLVRRWRRPVAVVATVLVTVLAAALGMVALRSTPLPLAGESITIGAFHGWQEGIVATFLWKAALERQGAEVEVRFAGVAAVYEAVATGEFDLAYDAWLPDTHEEYWRRHGHRFEDLGAWYTGASLTIAVDETAPIRSLAELSGAADDFGNRLVGIEAGAGLTRVTQDRVIPAYGLEEMQFVVSSTETMLIELQAAIDRGDHIVVTLWEPHWIYDAYPIRNLADPENALGDAEDIHAFARRGFGEDHPTVAGWVQDFRMSEPDLRSLATTMFQQYAAGTDEEYEESVHRWLDDRPDYLAALTGG